MAPPWRMFVFLVILFSFVSVLQVGAQPTGAAVVSSDLELLSLGDVSGGGRVTWTITGEQATLLRAKVLRMFDEQTTIPRGFAFGLQATGATAATLGNGRIDSEEAGQFLNYLENELEGTLRGYGGTEFRYVTITRADRLEPDLPAERSSDGLVGSTAATTAGIEIRFIFNAKSSSTTRQFSQADESFADALHHVFAFDAAEDLRAVGCPASCFPFPARGGWRVVPPPLTYVPGGPFLWHGNAGANPWNDTGAYPAAASSVTAYSADGLVTTTVDLRFGGSANLTVEHTGSAAPGYVLLVQASTDQVNWTNVTATNDGDGDPAVDGLPLTVLGTSVFDLNPWLGQRVYIRFNFTSNGDATVDGPGYFIRNMRIQVPSRFEGTIDFRQVDYVVGFLSFADFNSPTVRPHLIRTPVGEVMFYNARYQAGRAPTDRARYATFDFAENPQALFVVLVISGWVLGRMQDWAWRRYRRKNPTLLRGSASKVRWLHWLGRGVILVLVLFYFFPSLLGGAGLIVGGVAFWGLSLGSVAAVSGFTTFWYYRREKVIPPEPSFGSAQAAEEELPPPPIPPPPSEGVGFSESVCPHCNRNIEDLEPSYKCTCGQLYHWAHAAEAGTCLNCRRPLLVEPPAATVSVTCPSCAENNVVQEDANLAFVKCGNCGVILKEIEPGYNYLLIANDPSAAFAWFNTVVRKGVPGLCMSTTFPDKLRREYGLPEVEVYWLSDTNPGQRTLNPKRLDFEIMRALSNFVKNNKGGAIVLDGLEYLVVENTFDRVLKFIKKLNDLASVQQATLFVPITLTGLGPEDATLLRKEFDRVELLRE